MTKRMKISKAEVATGRQGGRGQGSLCEGDGGMNEPWLTRTRWECLQAFKRQPRLMETAFLAKQLITQNRRGEWVFPATGATMDSLREAGWVQGVIIGPEKGLGFRMGGAIRMWQLTDAGREAVKNCPDIFPGEPVYRSK